MFVLKKTMLTGVLLLQTISTPAIAETFLFSYNTELSRSDAYSSRGAPLEGWCAILQQDRANWHRFNKRDPDDEADPFFVNAERRGMMSGKCDVDPKAFKDPGHQIRSGNRQFYLTVQVFGTGNRITRISTTDGP